MLMFLFCRRHWDERVSRRQMRQLNALKERVKTLSSEKTALEGKLKKLFQSKKG